MEMCLKAGADVNIQDGEGRTALDHVGNDNWKNTDLLTDSRYADAVGLQRAPARSHAHTTCMTLHCYYNVMADISLLGLLRQHPDHSPPETHHPQSL